MLEGSHHAVGPLLAHPKNLFHSVPTALPKGTQILTNLTMSIVMVFKSPYNM